MKAFLITVAGMSSRFSKSLGYDCLKSIYFENNFKESLLYNLLLKCSTFDKYVIIGGYKFDELALAIDKFPDEIKDKLILLENIHYNDYGSGYSLYIGLKYLLDQNFDKIFFSEGDLWVDTNSFNSIIHCSSDVVTFNRKTIDAQKSVVFYFDINNNIHYLYDTSHSYLEIKEPFLSVYNSGQIWQFCDIKRVHKCFDLISKEMWQGTNLVFIQKYFGDRPKSDYELIGFEKWHNCNTIDDFKKIAEELI